MNTALKLPKEQVGALRPETLEAYLVAHGWKNDPSNSSADQGVFFYPSEPDAEALVPRRLSFGDYVSRVGDVLAMVAAVEQRPIWEVLRELSGSSTFRGESGIQTNGANGDPADAPTSEKTLRKADR